MAAFVKSFAEATVHSAVLIALAAPAASAQVTLPAAPASTAAQSAFLGTAFSTVVNGREVWITTSNGSRLKARVVAVAPAGLNVTRPNGQGQTIRFEDITRIQKVSNRLRTGTMYGLSVGVGLGAFTAYALCFSPGECAATVMLIYAGIGTGIGAGIGALAGAIGNSANSDDDTVYDPGVRSATTLALTPIVSRTRKGAALSITWR